MTCLYAFSENRRTCFHLMVRAAEGQTAAFASEPIVHDVVGLYRFKVASWPLLRTRRPGTRRTFGAAPRSWRRSPWARPSLWRTWLSCPPNAARCWLCCQPSASGTASTCRSARSLRHPCQAAGHGTTPGIAGLELSPSTAAASLCFGSQHATAALPFCGLSHAKHCVQTAASS